METVMTFSVELHVTEAQADEIDGPEIEAAVANQFALDPERVSVARTRPEK
jgi:hypothetical protein